MNLINLIPLILFLIGSFMVIAYVTKIEHDTDKVEYKYIPRSYEQRFNDPIGAGYQYGSLFSSASPLEM